MQNGPPIIRRSSLRRPTRGQLARRRAAVVIVVVLVLVGIWQFWPAGGSAGTVTARRPGGSTTSSVRAQRERDRPGREPDQARDLPREGEPLFDNYFGKYPGADGATEGPTLKCDQGFAPGPTVPLTDAPYMYPHDLGHAFVPGLTSINGGKMNGFNCVDVRGRHDGVHAVRSPDAARTTGRYADRFTLADHFFTSMYGPTFPEHLYTVAAQSYGIVDNKTTGTSTGPAATATIPTEFTQRFPIEDLTKQDVRTIMGLENHILTRSRRS